ncbi:uncharacterized protein C5orf34 homolog isoform X4 [Amblyraja radiata]|uniref:uncharacterized protein C5orf34 homolog isoform X4 n=1 Tax=Amblyraja radiata TaxID=386614 RepID=UPI001402BC38|nr:uncharacterized protein C5orf34 homolog isoform X4 [Amblyraja radiata]
MIKKTAFLTAGDTSNFGVVRKLCNQPAMALVSLMVLYEDDSVEVQLADGSSLQLSPCGSEFMIEKSPAPNLHPLQSCCRVRQRTLFTISIYKEQVLHALEFRNRFATCPYLPADLITADKLQNLFLDIPEVKWPGTDREGAVTIADNGRVMVSSLGGQAFLYLSPSRLEFTVEFLARVSRPVPGKPRPKPGLAQSDGLSSEQENVKPVALASGNNASVGRARGRQGEAQRAAPPCKPDVRGSTEMCPKYTHQYTWVVQHHTVSLCPPEWRHPLNLALHCSGQEDKSPSDHSGRHDKPETPGPLAVPEATTIPPKALPLNCPAPHLHRWRYRNVLSQGEPDLETCLDSEPVKVVWCQGVVYRVIAGTVTSVEIYPGDGSVLKAHDAMSNYFTHYRVGHADVQGEERMYRVSSLPPDTPGSKYSICSMVTRALRILQCWNQFKLSLKLPSVRCWITGNPMTSPTGLGETQAGWYRLLFPDRSSQSVQMHSAGSYERYVTAATDWCRHVCEKTQERKSKDMPSQQASGQEENWSVISELQKIQRFNFLLENSKYLKPEPPSPTVPALQPPTETSLPPPGDDGWSVELALQRTGRAIQDIELLLEANQKAVTAKLNEGGEGSGTLRETQECSG